MDRPICTISQQRPRRTPPPPPPRSVAGHKCWGPWGYCDEKDGIFQIHDGEYDHWVNFCPFCGAKAPKQIEAEEAADGD